jgi:HEAT repeat protein/lysophospholipase L1-like esterase
MKRRSLIVNLGLSLVVTLALLAVLEGAGRLLETGGRERAVAKYLWDWREMWGRDFYTIHADATGWPPQQEFNRDGLRDRAHTIEKAERTWRVAILGDSVTLGAGIARRDAFPQVLERRLRGRGRRVEVMNVALWGWSTRQERLAYERIARRYRPDAVILAVCLNDIPELQNNLTRPPRWLAWLFERSAFVRVVTNAEGREIRSVEELFEEPSSRRVEEAFDRFFAEVRLLREAARADRATCQVLVFPFRFQVRAGAPPPRAQERITTFCRAAGIPVMDLLPTLSGVGDAAFFDYDHLSREGARVVAREIEQSGWLPEGFSDAAIVRDLVAREGGIRPNLALLAKALGADEDAVRMAAAWGLSRLKGDRATRAARLSAALQEDSSAGVRAEAARGLGRMRVEEPDVRSALFEALADPHEVVRFEVAHALAVVSPDPEEDLDALLAAFESEDESVRAFAAWSLGRLGPDAAPAVPVLTRALRRGDPARAAIERALAEMGGAAAEAVPSLLAGLDAPLPQRRAGAARALGRLRGRAAPAVPALLARLEDEDARVRAEAARALGRIGGPARVAIPQLIARLSDDSARVRALAARALGHIPGAEGARPALERASRDGDRKVMREAAAALARLERAGAKKR